MDEFNEDEIRTLHFAEARDHTAKKGHQAVVRRGEVVVWCGETEHRTSRDATKVAKVWIDAEVGRQQRVELLRGRRRDELPEVIAGNFEKVDDLRERKAELAKAIKELEAENRMMAKECNRPEVTINMYEGTGTYTYNVTEKGNVTEVDSLQLDMFEEGGEFKPPTYDPETGEFPEDEGEE